MHSLPLGYPKRQQASCNPHAHPTCQDLGSVPEAAASTCRHGVTLSHCGGAANVAIVNSSVTLSSCRTSCLCIDTPSPLHILAFYCPCQPAVMCHHQRLLAVCVLKQGPAHCRQNAPEQFPGVQYQLPSSTASLLCPNATQRTATTHCHGNAIEVPGTTWPCCNWCKYL